MNLLEEVSKLWLIEAKSKKMKAAIRKQYGPPSEIEIVELPDLEVEDSEILVKVRATTVNRTDCAILTGKPFIMRFFLGLFKPRRATLGTDFSGEVVQIGKSVSRFQVGDRVFGFNDEGLSPTLTASGTVTAGKPVIQNTNGTVTQVAESAAPPISPGLGSIATELGYASYNSTAFGKNSQRVTAYRGATIGSGNYNITLRVATVSTTDLKTVISS